MGGWLGACRVVDILTSRIEHRTDGTPGVLWSTDVLPSSIEFSGWGCEFGNWLAFYSSDRNDGVRADVRNVSDKSEPAKLHTEREVSLPQAHVWVEMTDVANGSGVDRSLRLKAEGTRLTWMGDVVLRSVVDARAWKHAWVDEAKYSHENLNRYIETEDDSVHISSPAGGCLEVSWAESGQDWPAPFTQYLYVRDQPGDEARWVIHARLVCEQPSEYVYRLTRGRGVFWSGGRFGKLLVKPAKFWRRWRAAEFGLGGRGSLNGVWPLTSGSSINMNISLNLITCDRHSDER